MSESPKKSVFETVVRTALFACIFLIPVTAIVKMKGISKQSESVKRAIHELRNEQHSGQQKSADTKGNAENSVQLD